MIRISVITLGICLLVATVLLTLHRQRPSDKLPLLVFASSDGSRFSYLYRMNADGSDRQRISLAPVSNQSPAWSPDGKWIAYAAMRSGELLQVNSGHSQLISHNARYPGNFTWSPDGQWLMYQSDGQLYRVPIGGNYREELITNVDGDHWEPDWSPDGSAIALATRQGLYRMEPDGSALLPLTTWNGLDRFPAWSPNGHLIAFISNGGGAGYQIYAVEPDGHNLQRLTQNALISPRPILWSPDGEWIAFEAKSDGYNRDIFRVRVSDGTIERLTTHPGLDTSPTWSADGRWIAFETLRDGQRDIYRLRLDTRREERLTFTESQDRLPAWAPPIDYRFHSMLLGAVGLALIGFGLWKPLRI